MGRWFQTSKFEVVPSYQQCEPKCSLGSTPVLSLMQAPARARRRRSLAMDSCVSPCGVIDSLIVERASREAGRDACVPALLLFPPTRCSFAGQISKGCITASEIRHRAYGLSISPKVPGRDAEAVKLQMGSARDRQHYGIEINNQNPAGSGLRRTRRHFAAGQASRNK